MRAILHLGRPLRDAERRKGWFVVAVFAAFAGACLILPASPLHGVTLCPFRLLTGYSCPGCGMTRACVHFFRGDLAASFAYHPFGGFFVLGFGATALNRLAQNLAGRRIEYFGRAAWGATANRIAAVGLAILIGFGVGRFFLELSGFLTPV